MSPVDLYRVMRRVRNNIDPFDSSNPRRTDHHKPVYVSAFGTRSDREVLEAGSFYERRSSMKTSRALTLGFAANMLFAVGALAQQPHHGTVVQVEEAKGTITVTEAAAGTTGSSGGAMAQEYKVRDGLLFNALKVGDVVTFTVEENGGVKTITNLKEQ